MMKTAKLFSILSDDCHTKVGAVLAKDGLIQSIGYNHSIIPYKDKDKNSCMLHAEVDAILKGKGDTLYTTLFPCHECAKIIVAAGIKNVIYENEYHNEESASLSREILERNGINVSCSK